MAEAPRSNRPSPRTPAAVEAELRRRIRAELTAARAEADGELEDAALANVIAHAIGQALDWHLESPEHTRNATLSSRTWRPSGGPRAGGGPPPRDREWEPRRPRWDREGSDFERRPPPPDFERRPPPPDYERRPPPNYERRPPPPDFDYERRPPSDRGPRPRRPGPPGPRGGGGFSRGPRPRPRPR